jgi:antirestriction protein ArdC
MTGSKATDRLDALKGQLVEGVAQLVESDTWTDYLACRARFHDYSVRNCMLIFTQMPTATRCAGFKTWQTMGRQVRKGEHALWVLAPCPHRRVETIETPNGAEDREHCWTTFRPVPVFDISQTEGEPLPELAHPLHGEDARGIRKLIADLIRERGYSFELGPIDAPGLEGANGVTIPDERRVIVRDDLEEAMQAKTAVHELAHVILHAEHRDMPRPLKELEAESVAYLVLAGLGLDAADYSFGYLASWAQGRSDLVADVLNIGDRVSTTATAILDDLGHELPKATGR